MGERSMGRLAPVAAMILLAATACYVLLSPVAGAATDAFDDRGHVASASSGGEDATQVSAMRSSQEIAAGRIALSRLSTITETADLTGRIGAVDEVPVSFVTPQRVKALFVTAGQSVTSGQVLAQADERELARLLGAARERLNVTAQQLKDAEEKVAAQTQIVERRQASVQARSQRAISDAEAALRRAESNYELVRAGATPSERRASEAAIAVARAAVAKAESDVRVARQGPDTFTLRQAEQQVVTTRIALKKAEDDHGRLSSGPDPVALQAAERELMTAQTSLTQSQANLERLLQPDPVQVATAQRDIQRAQTALRVAEMNAQVSSSSSDGKTNRSAQRAAEAEKQSAIVNAKLSLQEAVDRLGRLRTGPPPSDIEVARRNFFAARQSVESAQQRVTDVRRGPDQLALEQAKSAIDSARLAHESALGQVESLRAGPAAEQMSSMTAAYQSAQAALRSAETQQAEMLARPRPAELAAADEQLNAARAALEQARVDGEAPTDQPTDDSVADLTPLQQAVSQEESTVRSLESDLMNARILAPFDGVVTAIVAKAEEGIEAGRPVMMVAPQNAAPVVLADAPRDIGARLAKGQRARVSFGGDASGEREAVVASVTDRNDGRVRVQLLLNDEAAAPAPGSPTSILVTTRVRNDVVVVPETAVRGTGNRRAVDVLDGGLPRPVEVEVGMTQGGETEILRGIEPGIQVVLTR